MVDDKPIPEDHEQAGSLLGLCVGVVACGVWLVLWYVNRTNTDGSWLIPYRLAQVTLISSVIWQVCDPFTDAAQWIGERLQLPGSIRGATLDAIASSMPELFAGIFFVLFAISEATSGVQGGAAATAQAKIEAGAEGFESSIATCAGSAVYSMILISAFCTLVISFSRPSRPTIDIEDEVVSRDGLWFLMCQILLIWFLFGDQMMWWMGVCLIAVYIIYIYLLYFDAKQHRIKASFLHNYLKEHGSEGRVKDLTEVMRENGLRPSVARVVKTQQQFDAEAYGEHDEELKSAGALFGYVSIPLNVMTTIGICMLIAADACFFLVEATIDTARTPDIRVLHCRDRRCGCIVGAGDLSGNRSSQARRLAGLLPEKPFQRT